MSDPDHLVTGLVAELQLYAKTNSPHGRSDLELPLLTSLCANGSPGRSIGESIDGAVAAAATRPDAAALSILFQPFDRLWDTNLSGRQRQAAALAGMSYDSFRRRRKGQPSPYDTVCTKLAEQLLGLEHSGSVSPPLDPTETASAAFHADPQVEPHSRAVDARQDDSNRMWRVVALVSLSLLALSLLALVSAIAFWPSGSDSSEDQAESAGAVCEFALATAESAIERARFAIEREAARSGAPSCVEGTLLEREGNFFYSFDERTSPHGGAVARPGTDGSFSAVILALGPWDSYSSLTVNDGGDAMDLAGFPTGEIVPSHGGYSLVTDGGGYFHGESPFSEFYWMPQVAYDVWVGEGAENGPLGAPASFVHIFEGSGRVDFENGEVLQRFSDGTVSVIIDNDAARLLPPPEEMAGTVILNRQGIPWFVDDELRRWWIPNVGPNGGGTADDLARVYECAGGTMNVSGLDLPGSAVHSLEFGGVASCPLSATGTYPRMGRLAVDSYCWETGGADTFAERDGDDWRCVGEQAEEPVDLEAVCLWQYGPTARLVTQPDEDQVCSRDQS